MVDTDYLRALVMELLEIDLKVQLFIDNKNCRDNIVSNVAPADKNVRCQLASIRESLLEGDISEIKLISGKDGQQLADGLTKRGAPTDRLLALVQGEAARGQ